MTIKEKAKLKPIDVTKFNVTENGNVIRDDNISSEKMTEESNKWENSFMKHELTPIEKMSNTMLVRKLGIARKNIEKWQKREEDIQRERSRRYMINNHFLDEIGR